MLTACWIRPDRVYRTGVVEALPPSYQPVPTSQKVAKSFVHYYQPYVDSPARHMSEEQRAALIARGYLPEGGIPAGERRRVPSAGARMEKEKEGVHGVVAIQKEAAPTPAAEKKTTYPTPTKLVKRVPPGLAKKTPALPPGIAKKLPTTLAPLPAAKKPGVLTRMAAQAKKPIAVPRALTPIPATRKAPISVTVRPIVSVAAKKGAVARAVSSAKPGVTISPAKTQAGKTLAQVVKQVGQIAKQPVKTPAKTPPKAPAKAPPRGTTTVVLRPQPGRVETKSAWGLKKVPVKGR